MLSAVKIPFSTQPAHLDEVGIRSSMQGVNGIEAALTLAQRKAEIISEQNPNSLVIGADQILEFDGDMFGKPESLSVAHNQLATLRGQTHQLLTGACVVLNGNVLWQYSSQSDLTMRNFSDEFLKKYLEQAGDALWVPGAYHLEGLGVTLFANVDGDYFSILGLPLMPLLDFLRTHGVMQA
jgi:septum formation protein